MMSLLIRNPIARHIRRSQRGQSIVLLALAFIALIAFVGLVTDVAMLFVRYAQLRRAVDAAAIAAAGQIREGTDYSEVTLAAEQYIELHGLNPDSVLVETCETDVWQWRQGVGPWDPSLTEPYGDQGWEKVAFDDKGPHPEVDSDSDGKIDPVSVQMGYNTELCNWSDPRKLVRVSAQISSPTSFLRLLPDDMVPDEFILEATSLSETAVLDVALVIDVSESMSKDTYIGNTTAAYPEPAGTNSFAAAGLAVDQLPSRCYEGGGYGYPGYGLKHRWGGCCNDVGTGLVSDGEVESTDGRFAGPPYNGKLPNGYIWHDTNGDGIHDPGEDGVLNNSPQTNWAAYDPDNPDPDLFDFRTLVCQPFKQVKDAARLFIKRLDFVRGDRVVFVTFDRNGVAYDPDGDGDLRPLIRGEEVAIETLNRQIGVWINPNHWQDWNICEEATVSGPEWDAWSRAGANPADEPALRPYAYESISPCGNTNIGGGILEAVNALTNPDDIRREAVWVMIVLSDGAANATNPSTDASGYTGPFPERIYGQDGYCPWWTFCRTAPFDTAPGQYTGYDASSSEPWPQCNGNNPSQDEFQSPACNDDDPDTRHFCLGSDLQQEAGNAECGEAGHYDADDFARDMADFAGLDEIAPDVPGNFIAMYSIAFGDEVIAANTGAPLLRYIADAGDDGEIDNDIEQDWRDNHALDGSVASPGDPDPCTDTSTGLPYPPNQQCGQYYYAAAGDPQGLLRVFEQIASRMFTRISR